jgi:hypothetical protein
VAADSAIPDQHEHEHVLLPSDPLDELEEVEPTSIDARLEQRGRGVDRSATIFNRHYLTVRSCGRGASGREYWLNLAFLDPTPVRRADRLRLTAAAACALPVAAVVFILILAQPPARLTWTLILPGGLLAVVGGLALALHGYFDELGFCTRHGRRPVLWLRRSRPDRGSVRTFLDRLRAAAAEAREHHGGSRGDFLRDEMKEHRRLLDQGAFGPREFEAARASILRAHG